MKSQIEEQVDILLNISGGESDEGLCPEDDIAEDKERRFSIRKPAAVTGVRGNRKKMGNQK